MLGALSLGDFHPPSLSQKGLGFSPFVSTCRWACMREIFYMMFYKYCGHVAHWYNSRMQVRTAGISVSMFTICRALGLPVVGGFFY